MAESGLLTSTVCELGARGAVLPVESATPGDSGRHRGRSMSRGCRRAVGAEIPHSAAFEGLEGFLAPDQHPEDTCKAD